MLQFYTTIMTHMEPFLNRLLERRADKGKEDRQRIDERRGHSSNERPKGKLIWLHAASVGEAQSAIILIHRLLEQYPKAHLLVTTGTQSSAERMQETLPPRAFHQFIPLDHPLWVERFLDHWRPDCVFWMESELWPNILKSIHTRGIPAALVNARLSEKSLKRWMLIKKSIASLLGCFDAILAQSSLDMRNFQKLGARHVIASGNLKYSASPLPCVEKDFKALQAAVGLRPMVVYASTHDGEEEIAANIHNILEVAFPDLLSVIIPRHPERGEAIAAQLRAHHPRIVLRQEAETQNLPASDTCLYIANTLGELGLFYRLSPIVYVGRSLSKDGGGGHNPLEPALLNSVVLHGIHVQNLRDIYDEMLAENACICVENERDLAQKIEWLLNEPSMVHDYISRARNFSNAKMHVIDIVMKSIAPLLEKAEL